MFVVYNIPNGKYLKSRYKFTEDLQKARTFNRRADATQAKQAWGGQQNYEVREVEVTIKLKEDVSIKT